MRVVVTGMIATYPVGGVAWDYGHYALGLERLGCHVTYLEDTGWQTYDPRVGAYGEDPSYGVAHLRQVMPALSPSLATRWHLRAMDGTSHGLSRDDALQAVAEADLFLNVSGAALLRPEYRRAARTALIDTDPGWNHFRNYPEWDARPGWQGADSWRDHDVFLTYAECLGEAACRLPDLGLRWHPTRPPVVVGCWAAEPPGATWTTVLTWKNFDEVVTGPDGTRYGTKEAEFQKVRDLPAHLPDVAVEVAAGGASPPLEEWRALGWRTASSEEVSRTAADYRRYVASSRGELSVAKNLYVATRSGWSSCRSSCYLACGRPVVLQDTGYSHHVPTGEGLLSFDDLPGAVAAVRRVESDYDHHATAARQVAEDAFDARLVLADLLDRVA